MDIEQDMQRVHNECDDVERTLKELMHAREHELEDEYKYPARVRQALGQIDMAIYYLTRMRMAVQSEADSFSTRQGNLFSDVYRNETGSA